MRRRNFTGNIIGFVLVFSMVITGSWWLGNGVHADAEETTAVRTLPSLVQPVQVFKVKISTNLVNGMITEKLPAGFIFAGIDTASTSCDLTHTYRENRNEVEFVYMGALAGQCAPANFTYKVIASNNAGAYSFGGTMTVVVDSETMTYHPVGGSNGITVHFAESGQSSDAEAVRTLPAGSAMPNDLIQVSIDCTGIGIGGVTETLPDGFAYVEGSVSDNIDMVQKDGQNIQFGFLAEPGIFTYDVIASDTDGSYEFNGTAKGQGLSTGTEVTIDVTGDSVVLVQAPEVDHIAVTTNSASSIGNNSAVLHGELVDMGEADSVVISFEWGKTGSYGNTLSVGNMTSPAQFSANLAGLEESTLYHFRAKAAGDGENVYGQDRIFTTSTSPASTSGPETSPALYQLTVISSPPDGGSVTMNPSGGQYESGSSVTLTAGADEGYRFVEWGGDISGSQNPRTIDVNSNMSITASFGLEPVAATPPTTTTQPPATTMAPPTTTKPPTTTAQPPKTIPPANGDETPGVVNPIRTTDKSGTDTSDDGGGGVNIWLIIGPILGVVVIGGGLYYFYFKAT